MIDCKEDICEMLDEVAKHLVNFASEGHRWLLNMIGNAKDEYLNLVNVKCSNASHLYDIAGVLKSRVEKVYSDPTALKAVVLDIISYLDEVGSLIKTSVNVVPYSKIDEFNILVYNKRHDLSNEILTIYYHIGNPFDCKKGD